MVIRDEGGREGKREGCCCKTETGQRERGREEEGEGGEEEVRRDGGRAGGYKYELLLADLWSMNYHQVHLLKPMGLL